MRITWKHVVFYTVLVFGLGMVIFRDIMLDPLGWRKCAGLSCALVALYWLSVALLMWFDRCLRYENEDKAHRRNDRDTWFGGN